MLILFRHNPVKSIGKQSTLAPVYIYIVNLQNPIKDGPQVYLELRKAIFLPVKKPASDKRK